MFRLLKALTLLIVIATLALLLAYGFAYVTGDSEMLYRMNAQMDRVLEKTGTSLHEVQDKIRQFRQKGGSSVQEVEDAIRETRQKGGDTVKDIEDEIHRLRQKGGV